eukprot:6192813-Pleurochrysis_carterae.AAC.2
MHLQRLRRTHAPMPLYIAMCNGFTHACTGMCARRLRELTLLPDPQMRLHGKETTPRMRKHAHTRAHTCARARTRTHTHAHARKRTRARTHAHARARTRTQTHAHTHACAHTRTHTHMHAQAHVCACKSARLRLALIDEELGEVGGRVRD